MTTINFKLSKTGILNEMRKGIAAKEKNSVKIDLAALSEEDRLLLLNHCNVQYDTLNIGKTAYRYNNGETWSYFYELGSLDIINEVKEIEAKEQEKLKQEEEKRKQLAEEEKQAKEKLKIVIEENRKLILGNKEEALKIGWNYWSNNRINNEDNYDQETIEFITLCKKEADEEKKRQEEDKKAATEAAKEKLRLWALMNGSELLQLRIEENMNWYDLANTEYFKSILPEGFKEMAAPDNSWEIKNATIEQIKALREVKKDHPEAKLMRYKYNLEPSNGEYFEDDEEETEHKDVIQITLKSISGEEKTFEKEL